MKALLFLLLLLLATPLASQNCELGTQDWQSGSNATPPDGWQRINGANIGVPFQETDPDNRAIGFNAIDEGARSPHLECVGNVEFIWRASGSSAEFTVLLQWSQTPDDESSWQSFHTITTTAGSSPTTYQTVSADLPEQNAVAPFEISVRWITTSRNGGTFYLDDVCFSPGTCTVQPTRLTFTQLPVTCIEVGAPFTVEVCATDDNKYVAKTFTQSITISAPGGPVQGLGSEPAIRGCITRNLTATSAGTFDLEASTATLNPASTRLSAQDICPSEFDLRVMSYNLLNFPNGRAQCEDGSDIILPNRQDTLAKIVQYVNPDVLMVCELQTQQGSEAIIQSLQNLNPDYAAATFVPNTSSTVQDLNNMLYYNAAKMTLVAQSVIQTGTRDVSRYRMQMNDPKIATAPDTVFIDFFVAHTKAGGATADRMRRADDLATFQAAFDQLSVDNAILGGDMNFYTSTEAAYQTLLNGANPWFDPVNTPGDWDNDATYADLHTQSSREFGSQSYDCGITGGLDSRFDLLLQTGAIAMATDGVEYLSGSYNVPGNEGNLFNESINDPSNMSGVPREVLEALFYMSDHLPVTMDLRVTLPAQALPAELLSFRVGADAGAKSVGMNWSVTEERGLSHYQIERLDGQRVWEVIGTTPAAGGPQYGFADTAPGPGTTFYRLRMVDLDGSEAFSPVRSAHLPAGFTAYPTVTGGLVYLQGADLQQLRVSDGMGRGVIVKLVGDGVLDLTGLGSGWYLLADGGGRVQRVFLR